MLSVATNGRRLCGRYTLIERLGAGGQGEVWRALDESNDTEIALKILSPALARTEAAWLALTREYEIASKLDHPSILKVYPPQRDGEAAVLPMELATGGDLRRLRGVSYLEIVPALLEIAHSLEHAHERGIVHRDLKPSNVLFDSRGRVLLADFGVAAGTALSSSRDALRSGMSPFTASPEQLRGDPPAISDDIYGLGALAYELLSGYPPYYPRFDLKRVLEEPVPELRPVHQAPPRLQTLITAMLAKKPSMRPRSMREVIDDLDTTLNDTLTFDFEDGDEPALPPPPPSPITIPAAAVETPAPKPAVAAVPPAPPRPKPAPPPVVEQPLPDEAWTEFEPPARAAPPPPPPPPAAPSPPPQVRAASARAQASPRFSAAQASGGGGPGVISSDWDDLKIEAVPNLMKLEPERSRRGPWIALLVVALVAAGAFYFLPQFIPQLNDLQLPEIAATQTVDEPPVADATPPEQAPSPAAEPAPNDPALEASLKQMREEFDQKLNALDARNAGVWGGQDYAAAKVRAAESVGAHDGGNPRLAAERMGDAIRLLDAVETRSGQALAAQIAAGERALERGDSASARQAFQFATRIDPRSQRASEGLRQARNLDGVLPLLAEGENAEAAQDYSRAVKVYGQALALDSGNATARAGFERANAALGSDTYAKAIGRGSAALGAGRLEEARAAFEQARAAQPNGREAAEGLGRVGAAQRARGFASVRMRATALEAEERWAEALEEYEAVLRVDPSLSFAQQGRTRTSARADLARRLDQLIENPQRLASPAVRSEALALMDQADAANPSGAVLRSQVARLQILLPEFDKPVRLSLESDNATQVAIQRIGSFGTFARREIELKPGRYTVVGTRAGYRDVRRDVTIAPGQDVQIISVRCVEPI